MIPEIIKNGKKGYMSNDPATLRKYVETLLEDDDLAREIGNNARQTILEKFGMKKFLESWNSLFLDCVE